MWITASNSGESADKRIFELKFVVKEDLPFKAGKKAALKGKKISHK